MRTQTRLGDKRGSECHTNGHIPHEKEAYFQTDDIAQLMTIVAIVMPTAYKSIDHLLAFLIAIFKTIVMILVSSGGSWGLGASGPWARNSVGPSAIAICQLGRGGGGGAGSSRRQTHFGNNNLRIG